MVAFAIVVLLAGCARRPPRVRALIKAREAGQATTNPTFRMSLLTGVGIEWLRLDKREGRAILRDVLSEAERSDTSAEVRADVVGQCSVALADADPSQASMILLDGLRRLRRIDPHSDARYSLLAALATRDLDQAVSVAKGLTGGERSLGLAHIAQALASTDLKRATELMSAALAAPSPIANEGDRWWTDLAVAAAEKHPTEGVALAGNRIGESRLRARVLFAAVEALAPHDRAAARALVAAEPDPGIQVWGWMALAHASRGEQRQAACEDARRALKNEWAAAMIPKWLPHDLRHVGLQVVRATTSPRHTPDHTRFSLVTQWSLFAVLEGESPSKGYPGAGEQAARDLASAEGWMSTPPRDEELGAVMAAASYVDPRKALRIYGDLLKRAPANDFEGPPWIALVGARYLIVRIDSTAVERMLAREPAESRRLLSVPTKLATTAGLLVQIGEPKRATEMIAAARQALDKQASDAREHRDDKVMQRGLWESMRLVAIGLAETGKYDDAIRVADGIRDRGEAGETYLTIAQIAGGERPKAMDRFEAVRQVATRFDGMLRGADPVLPWTPPLPSSTRTSRIGPRPRR